QDHGEECHGSGRSIDQFNLHGALHACSSDLLSFGGHEMAAGLKLRRESLAKFTEEFIAFCTAHLSPDDLVPVARYDCEASLEELDIANVRSIERLAPFGRGNPGVALRLRALRVVGHPETFGSMNRNLAIRACSAGAATRAGGTIIRFIGWNWAERIARIPAGALIDAIVKPKISTWGGNTKVEAEIVDLCVNG